MVTALHVTGRPACPVRRAAPAARNVRLTPTQTTVHPDLRYVGDVADAGDHHGGSRHGTGVRRLPTATCCSSTNKLVS
jgi:hypothetical protein